MSVCPLLGPGRLLAAGHVSVLSWLLGWKQMEESVGRGGCVGTREQRT